MTCNLKPTARAFSQAFLRSREIANSAWDAATVAWGEVDDSHESIIKWLALRNTARDAQAKFDLLVDDYRKATGLA